MKYLKNFVFSIVLLFNTMLFAGGETHFDSVDFDKVQIKTEKLSSKVYMLIGEGGNIGLLVGDDGAVLIDSQFAVLSQKIKNAVSKLTDKRIKFLVNTHWHFDHVGGNENFAKDGTIIIAHENARENMAKDSVIEAFNVDVKASPKAALPMLTFNDKMNLHLNDEDVELLHVLESHTDGDIIVLFKKANVIHVGDLFSNDMYPFIDKSNGGNFDGVIKSLKLVLSKANDDTKIIPGHGKLASKKDLAKYVESLIIVQERIGKLIKEGKTFEQIQALNPLADIDEKLGGGLLKPEYFLKITYDLIKDENK